MQKQLSDIIIVGVDPAPSKGLCALIQNPADADIPIAPLHYSINRISEFAKRIKELSQDNPVLICWDAPLTMQPDEFYARKIEIKDEVKGYKWPDSIKKKRWQEYGASVQGFASCSHWAITQKVLGYPSLNGSRIQDALIDESYLISEQPSNNNPRNIIRKYGVCVVEVHPALAMECRIDFATFDENGPPEGGRLSKKGTYKKVAWGSAPELRNGFHKLARAAMGAENAERWFPTDRKWKCPIDEQKDRELDPSDLLDAWVAMDLGMKWVEGKAEIVGNSKDGSFLLPTS